MFRAHLPGMRHRKTRRTHECLSTALPLDSCSGTLRLSFLVREMDAQEGWAFPEGTGSLGSCCIELSSLTPPSAAPSPEIWALASAPSLLRSGEVEPGAPSWITPACTIAGGQMVLL